MKVSRTFRLENQERTHDVFSLHMYAKRRRLPFQLRDGRCAVAGGEMLVNHVSRRAQVVCLARIDRRDAKISLESRTEMAAVYM